ncbi:hypothetical protein Y032_0022g633 [Ancylostoma ceylanicum]|uniref:EB domain-containing protein n=1 Tax=Ancylostoma ceylanicum TaxID=53326 RepID=A0A016UZ51_9BILA|nr:hypothetical protein Y032_0022g633 [Ancylostoma ceylanicum]
MLFPLLALLTFVTSASALSTFVDDRALIRHKRQTFYLCGVYPNQYYSSTPCQNQAVCPNGGRYLNVGCTYSAQCTPFYRGREPGENQGSEKKTQSAGISKLLRITSKFKYMMINVSKFSSMYAGERGRFYHHCGSHTDCQSLDARFDAANKDIINGVSSCINGCCCTVPTTPAPSNRFGICPSGQLSEVRCSGRGQCQAGQTCMTGLCCTTTGNEWNQACGGLAALGSCSNGMCSSGVCTASNYCCECPVGRSAGRCNNGICPGGFTCNNGFCCPQCPNNVMPFGACRNGVCGGGRTCQAGNICC